LSRIKSLVFPAFLAQKIPESGEKGVKGLQANATDVFTIMLQKLDQDKKPDDLFVNHLPQLDYG